MVAFPVVNPRQSTNGTGSLQYTNHKLVPRKGLTDVWTDELNDLLASRKLTSVSQEKTPPTLQDTTSLLPGVATHIVEAVYGALIDEWWNESTQLYHIVRGSIDISGVFEKKDLTLIKSSFLKGDYRDGPGLLRWATSFTNMSSVGEQARLLGKVLNAKLPANANLDQLGTHAANLLIDWAAIEGNSTTNPASFYFALHRSFPDVDGKLGHLRSWLSDLISDDDPTLADPSAFVERLMLRATTLGLPTGNGSGQDTVNALGSRLGNNNCNYCNAWVCTKGTTTRECLCLNPRLGRPKNVKDQHWEFVQVCRTYCKAAPGTTSLKGISMGKMAAAIKAAGLRMPGDSGGGAAKDKTEKPGGAGDSTAAPVVDAGKGTEASDKKTVTAIVESMSDDITDPSAFAKFINSLSIVKASSVNVITRSHVGGELPCNTCGRMHSFEFICPAMVGLSTTVVRTRTRAWRWLSQKSVRIHVLLRKR